MEASKEEDKETMQTANQMDGCEGRNNKACDVSARVVAVDDSVKVMSSKIMNVKLSSPDDFYEKLTRFYDSAGLSLIFNFRETKVDLYHFYKDVTERGGYLQVTKDGKWDEVASSLNAESGVIITPDQIQMIYANLFYQFEQTYYYRTNSKVKEAQPFTAALTGQSSCTDKSAGNPKKKQRHNEDTDGLVERRIALQSSFRRPTAAVKSMEKNSPLPVPLEETDLVLETPTKAKETKKSSVKEMKQRANAPMGLRTAYMIFLRMECERLKMIHGKGSPGQIKNMANDAWRCLSEHNRQPYIEASKRDKERYTREMAEFMIVQNQIAATHSVSASTELTTITNFAKPSLQTSTELTTITNFAKPSLQTNGDYHPPLSDDAYHVTLPHDARDNVVTDEELAADIMRKAASNDPTFQLNWDGYT